MVYFLRLFLSLWCWSIQKIPFRWIYHTGLADTFDAYLLILRRIDKQVLQALGRDTPNWQVLNACPPCGYEVGPFTPVTFSG
jgi:hypothetical protein